MSEAVNHPKHYQTQGGIEVIEMIEALGLGEGFCIGNAIKYAGRAGKKDQAKYIEDLEKAVWYLKRRIETAKAEQESREPTRPNDMNPREMSKEGEREVREVHRLMEAMKDGAHGFSATHVSTSTPKAPEPPTGIAFAANEAPTEWFYVGEWITVYPEGQDPVIVFRPDAFADPSLVAGDKFQMTGHFIEPGSRPSDYCTGEHA